MNERTYCKALIALMLGCLLCLILIPSRRASENRDFAVVVFAVGITVTLLYSQLRKHQMLGFLARPGPLRFFFRLLLCVPLLAFAFTVSTDAYERHLPIFRDAILQMEESDAAKRDLGVSIEAGWPIVGSYDGEQESPQWILVIPVAGSHGKGSLRVVGTKTNGVWKISELTLIVRDSSVRESLNVVSLH